MLARSRRDPDGARPRPSPGSAPCRRVARGGSETGRGQPGGVAVAAPPLGVRRHADRAHSVARSVPARMSCRAVRLTLSAAEHGTVSSDGGGTCPAPSGPSTTATTHTRRRASRATRPASRLACRATARGGRLDAAADPTRSALRRASTWGCPGPRGSGGLGLPVGEELLSPVGRDALVIHEALADLVPASAVHPAATELHGTKTPATQRLAFGGVPNGGMGLKRELNRKGPDPAPSPYAE
jgi:hypothetical protein